MQPKAILAGSISAKVMTKGNAHLSKQVHGENTLHRTGSCWKRSKPSEAAAAAAAAASPAADAAAAAAELASTCRPGRSNDTSPPAEVQKSCRRSVECMMNLGSYMRSASCKGLCTYFATKRTDVKTSC